MLENTVGLAQIKAQATEKLERKPRPEIATKGQPVRKQKTLLLKNYGRPPPMPTRLPLYPRRKQHPSSLSLNQDSDEGVRGADRPPLLRGI